LRVGEELRHALADVFFRGETGAPELDAVSITVCEVRVSPDLRHATAYVSPLGGGEAGEGVIERLNRAAGQIRRSVSSRMRLRYAPRFRFRLDTSFDHAMRISEILHTPRVARDIQAAAAEAAPE
jgi:ribosome-binding factor A